jgi:31-O-methyltransferase
VTTSSSTTELPNGLVVEHLNAVETRFLYDEIFVRRSYLPDGFTLRPGDCVFDVGANVGLTSLFFASVCPEIVVFAFEPIPAAFALLRANLRRHGVRARTFDCALGAEAGSRRIVYYPHNTVCSGLFSDAAAEAETSTQFLRNRGFAAGAAVEVAASLYEDAVDLDCDVTTLSRVVEQDEVHEIALLKIDVEKGELDVLRGLADEHWPRVRQIVVEVHDDGRRLAAILALLDEHGFETEVNEDPMLAGTRIVNVYARIRER